MLQNKMQKIPKDDPLILELEEYSAIPICTMCDRFIDGKNLKGYICPIGDEWVCMDCSPSGICETHIQEIPFPEKLSLIRMITADRIQWQYGKLILFVMMLFPMIFDWTIMIIPMIYIAFIGMIAFTFLNPFLRCLIKKKINTFTIMIADKKVCGPRYMDEMETHFKNRNGSQKETDIDWVSLRKIALMFVRSAEFLQKILVSVSTSSIFTAKYSFYRPLQLVLCHYSEEELEKRYTWDEIFRDRVDFLMKEELRREKIPY